ncbi:putative bifunctional diguanylate cyclase/phosphodiesterase [Amycolatopsis magusensis]|uniref:Diguanylate cyclase (GGDEF)-like protein/PAS domain S-box-containing protein n=1 Tax=Amycolatopsis magusensis TaxID=882444 RepID=A0ABS4PRP0_9PSEU|nr:EAL domain-containing protein [Amycolatopsis magusensis]MBP2182103.1 diguanylate cyclase (GGDEF)-like protein/PAS domain S-box-containing protein [Amycolatopsis magusensis]
MTVPNPQEDASSTPGGAPSARRRATLARKWAYLIGATAYLPYTHKELEEHLRELVDQVIEVIRGRPFDPSGATRVGARLVELRCVGPDSLRRTLEVLGKALARDQPADRVVLALGALTTGYSEAQREMFQQQQKELNRTLLDVEREARRRQLMTQAQFEEIFVGSASGVAVTDLDGGLVRINAALGKTLNRAPADIAGVSLFDLIHPEDAEGLRQAYRELLDGKIARLRIGRRMLAENDETMWVSLTGGVIRDATGKAEQFVTIVDDDTDVNLLQRRLSHQALHDALTGLPNRQFFSTRLEKALRLADPATGITVFHLDLDGFSVVTDGLGPGSGDRLLRSVAAALKLVVQDENAIVARLGGDEFGILIENTERTPDVGTTIRRINQELAEPVYLDENTGVAASASIGVADRPPRDLPPSELLRATDMTLRRAQRNGHRQWQLFDPEQDRRDRHRFSLAASMAGAWELGEIDVVHRPVVRLEDRTTTGVEALLRWNHPAEGVLAHEDCVDLAGRTGLLLPLGEWLLQVACAKVRDEPAAKVLAVGLTADQAADPDLVGTVRQTLGETELSPARLRIGFPARALLSERGEAADNLRVLAEIGVYSEILDFGAAGDVECLGELPVRTVRLARRLVDRQRQEGNRLLLTRSVANLVELAHLAGATVLVDGIHTAEQADWWRHTGADAGLGPYFTT